MELTNTKEYLSFHVTINSNRGYEFMSNEAKASYFLFIEKIFQKDLINYLCYREWRKSTTPGRRNTFIAQKDEDPAIKPSEGDICYLESNISHEVGGHFGRLHSHIYIRVCARKYVDWTINLFNNLIRLEYELSQGQKCHLLTTRGKDESLGMLLYSIKQEKENQARGQNFSKSSGQTVLVTPGL